jgi:glycosyltransferase involved in cell wall biosynthesis
MAARAAVVILSHRPALVVRALRSALAQTEPCQVIVQHERDAWPGKLNAAVRAARTDWIIPLCDDDLLHPEYAAACLEFANDGDIIFTDRRMWWSGLVDWTNWRSWVKRLPVIGHHHQMFGAKLANFIHGKQGKAVRMDVPPGAFAFGSPFPMTCTIRRTLWESLGGYDDTLPHADTEFWYRAVKAGARVVYVPRPLFFYRFHRDQLSRQVRSNGDAALAFHRKHFQDFGFAFTQRPDDPTKYDCTIIPPDEREQYARRNVLRLAS